MSSPLFRLLPATRQTRRQRLKLGPEGPGGPLDLGDLGGPEKLADRTLTDEQVRSIGGELKSYSGQEYEVVAYWDNIESVGIAVRGHQALQVAHWAFLPLKEWHGLFGGVVGIQVWRHADADEQTRKAAESLVSALTAKGLQAEVRIQNAQNNPTHSKISLNVGSIR